METQTSQDIPSRVVAIAVFAVALMGAGAYFGYRLQRSHLMYRAQSLLADWPQTPRLLARLMLERYGPPDRVGSGTLVWYKRAPWKRVVVHEDQHRGPLEEVVAYDVGSRDEDAIRDLGRGVYADAMDSELSAQSDAEWRNFLALNMADDISRGARVPAEARKFYDKTAALAVSGKSSAYTAGLLFDERVPAPDLVVKDLQY